MSSSEPAEQPGALTRVYRTVTPATRWRKDTEMDAVGWTIFALLLALLIPLLPVLVIVWLVSKVTDAVTPNR